MIDSIRNVDLAISGNGKKQVTQSERNNIIHSRKSIHLNKNLNKGEKIKESDLIMLRPGDGVSPMDVYKVIGKKLINEKLAFTKINFNDFE